MKIIQAAREFPRGTRGVCLALGFFDGVHIGHQRIISETTAAAGRTESAAVVITFDQHPSTIVSPRHVPPLIYTLPQRLRAIESLQPEAILLFRFDKEFSQQPGEVFIRSLAAEFPAIHSICVGQNFVFGHRRGGDVELLRRLGAELGFSAQAMPPVTFHGKPVSSTRVRNAVLNGDLEGVVGMLGRPYSLAGRVDKGDGLGRQLGYPTANINVTGLAVPPHGVYEVSAAIDGATFRGALNIGVRPTLGNPTPQLRVEAHLLDFEADLYGRELELVLHRKLRPEVKFPTLAALREQIAVDVASIRGSRGAGV